MNRQPLNPVIADDRDNYNSDGVVCLRGMFDAGWVTFMRDWVERAMAAPGIPAEEYEGKGSSGRFFGDLDIARRHAGFRKFVHATPAAEIAGRIMGASRIIFFYDQLLFKEPGTSTRTPWHQDQSYWAVSGRQVCSVWLALDRVEEKTSVEFVAGSHNWPEYSPYHFADKTAYAGTGLPPLPDIEAQRQEHRILRFALEPSDCLVFQAMITHGAPGNSSAIRRRALATRWTGDDARYCIRLGEVGIPVRDPGLSHGDVMDCEDFPVVWRAQP